MRSVVFTTLGLLAASSAIILIVFVLADGNAKEPGAQNEPVAIVDPQTDGLSRYRSEVLPILEEYCYDCHGDGMDKGGMALDEFASDEEMLAAQRLWGEAKLQVSAHVMPPSNKPSPSIEERKIIADWIEDVVFWCDCENPDPGRVVLRRLNRVEYNNTVRDVFGINFQPADSFPPDDTGYGYDNIADVLSLSPSLLEKYYTAAVQITGAAVIPPPPPIEKQRFSPRDFSMRGQGQKDSDFVFFSSSGGIVKRIRFPERGRYRLKVAAAGTRGGNELPKLEVRLGRFRHVFDVDAEVPSRKHYEVTFDNDGGERELSLAFINDFYDPGNPNPRLRDRNLGIGIVEIEGPLDRPPPPPSTFRKWAFDKPIPSDKNQRREYAKSVIEKVGLKLFRRPLTDDEVNKLAGFLEVAEAEGDGFDMGMALAVEAMLISPHFLFRGGGEPEGKPDGNRVQIDEFSLASRLSYFLWSSCPDDELLDLAARGKLRSDLDNQIDRMLKDEKSNALAENFAGQWLQLRNMQLVSPDPGLFPGFDKRLSDDMRRETEMVFTRVIRDNRSVLDFLTADYTFANERLAKHYGIDGVSGEAFREVSLKGTGRSGVLTHASILTLTSNPDRTSPVKRGKFILENILSTPPPPPPEDVPELEEGGKDGLHGSLRERLEKHRSDPNCAGCHNMMDPLGFAYEKFDAVGAFRTQDDGIAINASGELVTGEQFSDHQDLGKLLGDSQSQLYLKSLTEHLLTYALGRGLEHYDKCAVEEIIRRTEAGDNGAHALIRSIIDSVPFQMRRVE